MNIVLNFPEAGVSGYVILGHIDRTLSLWCLKEPLCCLYFHRFRLLSLAWMQAALERDKCVSKHYRYFS